MHFAKICLGLATFSRTEQMDMHQGIHIINLALKSALTLIIINNATITIRITMKYLLLHINHNMIQICIKHTKNVTCIN